jgi:hypothetical protein
MVGTSGGPWKGVPGSNPNLKGEKKKSSRGSAKVQKCKLQTRLKEECKQHQKAQGVKGECRNPKRLKGECKITIRLKGECRSANPEKDQGGVHILKRIKEECTF